MTLTTDQRRDLVTDPAMRITALDVDVLDPDGRVVGDATDTITALTVEHSSYADRVHRIIRAGLIRPLAWGRDRIRPTVTVTGGGHTADVTLGVFAVTSTPQPRGHSRPLYACDGYDLGYLLDQPLDRAYVASRSRSYLDSVREICLQQGLDVDLPPGPTTTPPTPKVWTIADGATWRTVTTELLAAVGFHALAMRPDGRAYSDAYQPPDVRPTVWDYDTTIAGTAVRVDAGQVEHPYTDAPNRWVAYRVDPELGPARRGNGIAVVDNLSTGPASQSARSLVVPRVEQHDAVDQASLQAAADMMRDADGVTPRRLTLVTRPVVWHGHLDVVTILDPQTDAVGRWSQVSWQLDVFAGEMTSVFREVAA